ncbi:MAG TPA: diaminopimelate epimerase [Candidatus Lustribacter sp.]|jgi:diaminopimelate epimerase|nr:diaminopimelate epimerase [Candidatus Lustribacter sp.]
MNAVVPFVKMNGTRNEFVIVDGRETPLDDPVAFALRICDPSRGPGADGLLLALDSATADVRMRVINADGSEAEMCGNGIRCMARYLDEHDGRAEAIVETLSGPIATRILSREPYTVSEVMGVPRIGTPHEVAGFTATPVDVGNPHVVIFVDDLAAIDINVLGPRIEGDPRYRGGMNVHFAQVAGKRLRVLHWERGAGATAACGTGAVACAAVAMTTRGFASPVTLDVPGGTLRVEWSPGERATLIGDAVVEFSSTFG